MPAVASKVPPSVLKPLSPNHPVHPQYNGWTSVAHNCSQMHSDRSGIFFNQKNWCGWNCSDLSVIIPLQNWNMFQPDVRRDVWKQHYVDWWVKETHDDSSQCQCLQLIVTISACFRRKTFLPEGSLLAHCVLRLSGRLRENHLWPGHLHQSPAFQ